MTLSAGGHRVSLAGSVTAAVARGRRAVMVLEAPDQMAGVRLIPSLHAISLTLMRLVAEHLRRGPDAAFDDVLPETFVEMTFEITADVGGRQVECRT